MSEKQNNYDIWLHWHMFDACNLDCAYCLVHKVKKKIKYPPIHITALLRTLNATNKTFKIGYSGGGEPFLIPNLIEACKEITKKHYIAIITNLTSPHIKTFAESISPHRTLSIIASAHIEELKSHHLLNTYFTNFLLLKENGFTIDAMSVAYPPYSDKVDEYKQLFRKKGIELQFNPFIGKYNGKKYPLSYTSKELKRFGMVQSHTDALQRHYQHQKICNAGYNVGFINQKGDMYPCASIHKKMGNIYSTVNFNKNVILCPLKFCLCPLNAYDPYLFNKALKEVTQTAQRMNSFFIPLNFFRRVWHKIS